jgi:hypothetical protein
MFHLFSQFCTKNLKNHHRVAMANMTLATRACVQCWSNCEYFMLKQCLENIGEGLLHAGISSILYICQHCSLCVQTPEFLT